jgi:hypothetical protein
MPDAAVLLEGLRTFLIAKGAVRSPTMAGAALPSPPPLFLQPEGGAPGPGDKKGNENHADIMLSAFMSGGLTARTYEEDLRRDTVDIWFRCRKMPFAAEREALLRSVLLIDPPAPRNFFMGAVQVHACQEWRPLQPLAIEGAPHNFVWSLLFDYWAG